MTDTERLIKLRLLLEMIEEQLHYVDFPKKEDTLVAQHIRIESQYLISALREMEKK